MQTLQSHANTYYHMANDMRICSHTTVISLAAKFRCPGPIPHKARVLISAHLRCSLTSMHLKDCISLIYKMAAFLYKSYTSNTRTEKILSMVPPLQHMTRIMRQVKQLQVCP